MKALLILSLILSTNIAFAKKDCTTVTDKTKWMTETEFKKKVETEGYVIKKFKTEGHCYEIYGTDKSGKEVEVYFNPVDGSVSKKK